jgi:hypothetical protein
VIVRAVPAAGSLTWVSCRTGSHHQPPSGTPVTEAGSVVATCRVLGVVSGGTVTVTWWDGQFSVEVMVRVAPAASSKYTYELVPEGYIRNVRFV